jgi:hypothetical protein
VSDALAAIFVIGGLALLVLLAVLGVRWVSSRGGALPLAGRDLWFAVGAIFLLPFAIGFAFSEPLTSLALFASVVVLLAMPVGSRIGGAGGRTRVKVSGRSLVIDGLAGKVWAGRLMITVAGVGGLVWFIVGTTAERWAGLAMTVCFGIALVAHAINGLGRYRIVIDQDGLRWQAGTKVRATAWDELDDVHAYDIQHTWFLSLPGPDLPLESFPVQAEPLADALRAWAADPDLRAELGTEAARRRLLSAREARQPVELQAHEVGEHR